MIVCYVLAVLSLCYGIFVGLTTAGSKFHMVWFGMAALFAMLARANVVGLAIAIFFGIVVLIVEIKVLRGFRSEERKELKYIIVLGAHVIKDQPCKTLQYRIDLAAKYLAEHGDTLCIVSGGKGSDEAYTEAYVMNKVLVESGIPQERIIMEDQSVDTVQNIRYSMKHMKSPEQVGIITNNFHMYRALEIAKSCGLKNPVGIAAPATPVYLPNNMFREFFALLKFWFQCKRINR